MTHGQFHLAGKLRGPGLAPVHRFPQKKGQL